jgi:hypothetical protein
MLKRGGAPRLHPPAVAPYPTAMVRLQGVPPRGIVLGFKGSIDYYSWKGIPVARRWPRSPGKRRAPAVEAQWDDFRTVTQGFKAIDSTVIPALASMSNGTQITTKDQQVQLFYGYAIEETNGVFP